MVYECVDIHTSGFRKEKKMEEEEIGVSRATTDGLASASLKLLRKSRELL